MAMVPSMVEEKKRRCRDILELGMDVLAEPKELSWFDWERLFGDLEKALQELDEAAREK